jgi:gluconate 2-dehydrogenase alpha chain
MGVHWNGQIWRFLPTDFLTRSHNQQRYGKSAVNDYDLTVQDWGITYEELEPHYDAFDKLCGTSGKAGHLRGQIQSGGNPFEGSTYFPDPLMPAWLLSRLGGGKGPRSAVPSWQMSI